MHDTAPRRIRDRSFGVRRPEGRRLGAVLLLAVCSALLLALVAARWGPLTDLDAAVVRTMHRWALAQPALTRANHVLSDWVWDPWTMRALATVTVAGLLWHRAGRAALWLAVTCGCGTLAQQGVKAAVGRDRPVWRHPVDSAHFAAFPSGHAMTATVVCGALLWLLHAHRGGRGPLWWTACTVAVLSVAGVGLTRVWLGVHWPSDVLGGWLLGALTVALAGAPASAGARRAQRGGRRT